MNVKIMHFFRVFVLLLFLPFTSFAQEESPAEISLEDLLNMEITSVSKKTEKLIKASTAIYVITSEDIQRSTAQNLMQLLRENVPGYWAVANDYSNADAFIRNTYEGSVLILLDGTPMFDLLFSSFDYENFEMPLGQIDRIEVIRGSGGTIYGANSATGVINIFTKNAKDSEKIYASAGYSLPGKAEANLIGKPLNSEKANATVYGKFTSFSGFEQMPEIKNTTSIVPKTFSAGDTTIFSRYTEDDNKYTTAALGFNLNSEITEKLSVGAALHYNFFRNDRYMQFFPPEKAMFLFTGNPDNPKLFAGDSVAKKEFIKQRVVGNFRADYSFSYRHNMFLRVSANKDNADYIFGGGYNSKNNFIDFELQDNIDLPFNNISFGGNYRFVNYDLSGFDDVNQVLYSENKNSPSLAGLFVLDKVSLLADKLNFYLGLKAENFSLIDKKFYLSPMAKVSVIPTSNLTFWGGYAQSFTTPGYNQTNIEYTIFRAKSPELFYNFTFPLVSYGVYQDVYSQAINGGADEATAAAMAQAFIQSPGGLYVIDSVTNQSIAAQASAFPGHFSVAAINGLHTKPTSFQNIEAGARFNMPGKFSFETSFFYSIMKDGVGNGPVLMSLMPSVARDGENIQAYYYGNYFKGTNMGLESVFKFSPLSDLMIELSHAWFKYTLEFQENDDFDLNDLSETQKDLVDDKYKQVPENIVRAKIYYTLDKTWKFSVSSMFTSAFYTKFGNVSPTYQYDYQRFNPLYDDGGTQTLIGGQFDNRFVLNLRIDKFLLDQKLGIFVYGNDVTSGNFTEGINQLETIYPRQIGAMFGAGISYTIK
ncbi:MAG: TonB-dependent receptor plug domain-containing protein [Bacteroidales bacterium]|nr:TonB-dependent receptor plug domain-containing protein [Bacteroidales bacterium]